MKITQIAANRGSGDFRGPRETVLIEKDLITGPPPSFFWNRLTSEVEITLTGEKTRGSTYNYTTTLTVSDLLSCLEKTPMSLGAAEKAVSLAAIAFLRVVLLPALKPPRPQPRANKTKPVRP